jgi:serine/threonine-protein kinase
VSATLTHIGKYRIERELGRGAMGVVYKAFDPVVERAVAIKTIRLDVENAEELVTRLRREAKSVGQLEHQNIVTLYDAGESSGLFYLAMQFIQGETLQDRITRQKWFTLKEVLEVFEQVCAGLDYAHQRGVIHRDIKPANIMITHDSVIKLTDFGIAKVAGTGTTSTGMVMGTPSYMSPEQVAGKKVDGRADLFSLGVMLYEMMTGEKPFEGDSIATLLFRISSEPHPDPVLKASDRVGPAVKAIIDKALQKNPDNRYQRGADMAKDLRAAIQNPTTIPPVAAAAPAAPAAPPPASAAPSDTVRVEPRAASPTDTVRTAPPNGGETQKLTPPPANPGDTVRMPPQA